MGGGGYFRNFTVAIYQNVKVLSKRFHLNGNTNGFCPQIQKSD